MTTVTAGSTSSFSLGPFNTFTVTAGNVSGLFALTSRAQKMVSNQTLAAQNGTFGPYGVPMDVVLTVSAGSVTYRVNPQIFSVPQYAWADRPSASSVGVGAEIIVNDLPSSGMLSRWYSDGTNFRVFSPVLVARNNTLLAGINATGEQYLGNISSPAGILFPGAMIEWRQTFSRSDATDATAATSQRIGAAGTVADAAYGGVTNGVISSTSRTSGHIHQLRVTSNSELQAIGSPVSSFSGSAGGSGSATPTAALTLSGALYFGASVALSAATGTTLPQVFHQELWMLP